MTAPITAAYLPAPTSYEGADRCTGCAGSKVTGTRYDLTPDGAKPLVVDELCPTCGGCGRATHDGCQPSEHASWPDYDLWPDDESFGDPDTACMSCSGRRWWACQGFNEDYVTYLRVPCGCATDLLVEVEIGGAR